MIASLLILLRLRLDLGRLRFMPLASPIVLALAFGPVLRRSMRATALVAV